SHSQLTSSGLLTSVVNYRSNHVVYVSRYRAVVCDELIPELEDSQSESEDELPLPEIDTPIPSIEIYFQQ
ncbi:hypothetical protein L9F63_008607, partial [Diploptera punctata]